MMPPIKMALFIVAVTTSLWAFTLNAYAETFHLICHTHRIKPQVDGDVIQEFDVDSDRQEYSWTASHMSGVTKNSEKDFGDLGRQKTEVTISSRFIREETWDIKQIFNIHFLLTIDRSTGVYSTIQEYIVKIPQEYKGPKEGIQESGTCEKQEQSRKF